MDKKVFKTGDVITPEFMNALQDLSFEKEENEVGHLPSPGGIENVGKVRVNEEDSNPRFLESFFNKSTSPASRVGNLVFEVKLTSGGLVLAGDIILGWTSLGINSAVTLDKPSDKDYNIYFTGSDYTVTINPHFLQGLNGTTGAHYAVMHNVSNGTIRLKLKSSANGQTWYNEVVLPEGISFLYYFSTSEYSGYRVDSVTSAIQDVLQQIDDAYVPKSGGEIEGNLSITGSTEISNNLNVGGSIIVDGGLNSPNGKVSAINVPISTQSIGSPIVEGGAYLNWQFSTAWAVGQVKRIFNDTGADLVVTIMAPREAGYTDNGSLMDISWPKYTQKEFMCVGEMTWGEYNFAVLVPSS